MTPLAIDLLDKDKKGHKLNGLVRALEKSTGKNYGYNKKKWKATGGEFEIPDEITQPLNNRDIFFE